MASIVMTQKMAREGPAIESAAVSVIIPTYNRSHAMGRAIRSVLHQSYQNFEIVVIDDASTDHIREVINDFLDPRVRYIRHTERLGGSTARNTGIEAARGKYVAFLDSDDEWLPAKLEKQVELLQRTEASVGVVYTGFAIVNENGQITAGTVPKHRGWILDELYGANVVRGGGSSAVVKRDCFLQVQPFDPAMPSCQDWDMWIRLAKRYEFDFVPNVLVHCHLDECRRITTDWRVVAEGHVRIAQKYLAESGEFPRRQRAKHLFALGSRLAALGYEPSYPEPIRLGKELLLAAFLTDPGALRSLAYYAAAANGKVYGGLIRTEPRVHEWLKRVVGAWVRGGHIRHTSSAHARDAADRATGMDELVDHRHLRHVAEEGSRTP